MVRPMEPVIEPHRVEGEVPQQSSGPMGHDVGEAGRADHTRAQPTSSTLRSPARAVSTLPIILAWILPPWPSFLGVLGATIRTDGDGPGERNNPFQVLSDGTQDLAALVGIFATNSVERYAFDFPKGALATGVSYLSLLGLLGYVRGLMKLALGLERCNSAGLSTLSLRPILGLSPDEALTIPEDDLVTISYFRRVDGAWRIEKTEYRMCMLESTVVFYFALHKRWSSSHHDQLRNQYKVVEFNRNHFGSRPFAALAMGLLMMICSGITSFTLLAVRDRSIPYRWTTWGGTVVLFSSTMLGITPWMWLYWTENISSANRVIFRSVMAERIFIASNRDLHGIFPTYTLTPANMKFCRFVSGVCGLAVVLGYICQYIEVRQFNPIRSGIWLAIHTALALLRVGIWLWDPKQSYLNLDEYGWMGTNLDGFRNFDPLGSATTPRMHANELLAIAAAAFSARNSIRHPHQESVLEELDGWNKTNIIMGASLRPYRLHMRQWISTHLHRFPLADAFSPFLQVSSADQDAYERLRLGHYDDYWDLDCTIFSTWLRSRLKDLSIGDPRMEIPRGIGCRFVCINPEKDSESKHPRIIMFPAVQCRVQAKFTVTGIGDTTDLPVDSSAWIWLFTEPNQDPDVCLFSVLHQDSILDKYKFRRNRFSGSSNQAPHGIYRGFRSWSNGHKDIQFGHDITSSRSKRLLVSERFKHLRKALSVVAEATRGDRRHGGHHYPSKVAAVDISESEIRSDDTSPPPPPPPPAPEPRDDEISEIK